MAANTNARFYRLPTLPNFAADGKHVGLFVYVPEYTVTDNDGWIKGYSEPDGNVTYPISTTAVTITSGTKVNGGLWFGGQLGWEHLTNVGSGISWKEIYHWFDTDIAGEAEIFSAAALTGTGETGTEITIFDPVLDRTNGLHASSANSDTHTFTVGDGALKISGSGATENSGSTPVIPTATTNDVHSANDVLDSTLTLDDSLIWTPSTQTIGVRTNQPVLLNNKVNPIATMADIAGLNGAMHLVGTLGQSSDWPNTVNTHPGDTYIVTGVGHTGPDGVAYEPGDTVVYYDTDGNGTMGYKVVNTNIRTGTEHGQHPMVDMPGGQGQLAAGKLVIATNGGITTSNLSVSDFIKDIETTQEIVNEAASTEGSNIGATYTVTTTITKPDGPDADSDSEIKTDTHSFTLHSKNNSLTIEEHNAPDGNAQIDFDLVWLTTIV